MAFVHFDESDVVRHHLVQRIIRAYDEHKAKIAEQQTLPLAEISGADSMAGLDASAEKKAGKLAIVREEIALNGEQDGNRASKIQEG